MIEMAIASERLPKPEFPLEICTLFLKRSHWRSLDYDGLVGSFKPVVDGLVTAGILIDDSWKVTGPWQVTQDFRPKADGPLVEIMVMEKSSL